LESLPVGFSSIPYDVWVVDNGSNDGSVEMIKSDFGYINLIQNHNNLGFAKANNQALKRVNTTYSLLLNSDTLLTKDCIVPLYKFLLSHPEAAMVGPRLVYGDGKLQPSTYPLPRLFNDILFNLKLYRLLPEKLQAKLFLGSFWNHGHESKVGRLTGACILLRMSDIRSVDFFDESFFFYGEMHDLCWTLWKRDRETWFTPSSEVIHFGGQTSKKMWSSTEQRRRMWRESERLLQKHQSRTTVRVHILLTWFSLIIASMAQSIYKSSRSNIDILKVDFDWYNNRLREMFWYRTGNFFKSYFTSSFYNSAFHPRLFRRINIEDARMFQFKSETDTIQKELINKWSEQFSSQRTGFMDFSCSALLYHLIRWLKPTVVVETGVANGISSTFILAAMEANNKGQLYSIDWPGEQELSFLPEGMETGWMVPNELRTRWSLQIGTTEENLAPLLANIETIDMFLHDSDHSYETMMYEYKTAWPYLKKNGLLLSDDVKMNTAFLEFTKDTNSPSIIYKDRLGIARKLT
jgi:GT2 family glycosyltransferase/predicted O-methyltransferase YrrM